MELHNLESVIGYINDQKINRFKIGIVDFNGVLRGKYVSKSKFLSGLESRIGFCDVIVGSDVDDQLLDNMSYTGWHTGYPDAPIKIIPETAKRIPFEKDTLFFICEFADKSEHICPRSILRKVINKAEQMGFAPISAFEYEFTVFDETMHSVREKDYKALKPLSPDNFGYSFLRSTRFSDFYHQVMDVCDQMGAPIEGFHTEIGPGVLEAAIAYSDALSSADNAIIFKNMVKIIAQQNDFMATFMPKWSPDLQGQSGHIHISLKNEQGENIFYDSNAADNMSEIMQQFIAGQLKYMPELLAMVASTVNDYVRLTPGYWAPTRANWGVDNRTTALRVIAGSAKAQRVEFRVASAATNPYLGLAVALLSGLTGIEEKLPLPEPVIGNAYAKENNGAPALPTNLMEAAKQLRESSLAQEFFGKEFVENYAASREWEEREYRRQITDWQLRRYFEII